jgi:tRNA pseudouridine38-40 synthase
MPRYKLLIEYDGAPFWGWQYQDKGPSVQGALEDAVKAMTGQSVRVNGAGAPMPACMRSDRWLISI